MSIFCYYVKCYHGLSPLYFSIISDSYVFYFLYRYCSIIHCPSTETVSLCFNLISFNHSFLHVSISCPYYSLHCFIVFILFSYCLQIVFILSSFCLHYCYSFTYSFQSQFTLCSYFTFILPYICSTRSNHL